MSRRFNALIPIRFSDFDPFGHVNHSVYLTYCEDHRTEMFNVMGQECGSWLLQSGFVVVSVSCQYLKALTRTDRNVEVDCSVLHLGNSSLKLHYLISSGSEPVADVVSTLVLTDGTGPRAMAENERAWLSSYLEETSESEEV
jgi:acyl-CoA thioester hydrolase